jgi:hypothetical protein
MLTNTNALSRELTAYEEFALATTAMAIARLPSPMQQLSNACDMLDMIAGLSCGRDEYILRQALECLDSYSGWCYRSILKADFFADDSKFIRAIGREQFDVTIAKAIELQRMLLGPLYSANEDCQKKGLEARP